MTIEIRCDRCHHDFTVDRIEDTGDVMQQFRCPQCTETLLILADALFGHDVEAANDDVPAPPRGRAPPTWDDDVDLEIDVVLDGWLGAV